MYRYLTLLILISIKFASGSMGDRSPFYQKCVDKCHILNCTNDGEKFEINYEQPIHLQLLAWSCADECKYNCMWKTVNVFHERNWSTPQFYGKWPFIRFFGLQEPASVVFSVLNLLFHLLMFRHFLKVVRPDSPLYWMWFVYCVVCCHAWFWSSVFHARDFPLTELLDYACAFSIVLINGYVMFLRVSRYFLNRATLIISTIFLLAFFISHTIYLSKGEIDYEYNMQLNIIVGIVTALCWFIWAVIYRFRQPYVWKCAIYVALSGLVLLLELIDRPPILYVFDFHSLWHLATAPLVILIYSFAIDDCRYLRKIEIELQESHKSKNW